MNEIQAAGMREYGEFLVEHVRDGKVIHAEVAHNFLANEGEAAILDAFFRGQGIPTGFTLALLSTVASPAEGSTWAALSANEMTGVNAPGYAAAALTRDTVGWPTLETVDLSGSGGEAQAARVSTKQVTITATGGWTAAAKYMAIRATIGGVEKLIAVAQLSADRQLANADQLNLTYRMALQ